MKRNMRRVIRAQLRDIRVLFYEFRNSLFLLAAVVAGGAIAFHLFYTFPGTTQHPHFAQSLHAAFFLIFLESVLPFPDQWYLQILFFAIPILGLAAIADGVLKFGAALVNKQSRGQKWEVAMASTYADHVVVCGIGKVGYRVAKELLKFGREVVGLESNGEGRFVEKAKALGVPVVIGDACRTENILKAGVESADAIIPCTDNELANLDIALDAREVNPNIKVVLRMFDPDLARRVEKGFGIHTAFSTSALAAPIFAAAATRANVKYSFYANDHLLNLSEIVVESDSSIAGRSINGLEQEFDISVVYYEGSAGTDLHPDPNLQLNGGDKILLLASLDALKKLDQLNCKQGK